jgi:hypothetical protein
MNKIRHFLYLRRKQTCFITSGSHIVVGENPDLFDCEEVHSVASLLKLYLRQLPEPLIPFEFFDMFISAACGM